MKDTGRAEIRCRCPFCASGQRKLTASLNTDKGLFHCHRCGEGLNAVTLYAKVYGTDTKDAYKELLEVAV
jgi:transposase-like protein